MSVTDTGHATIVDRYIDIFSDSSCSTKVGSISGSSGTFSGLTANKTYYVRANASNGTFRGYSSVATTSTYQYPYISAINTSALTIGDSQTITLYNPLGRSVAVYMKKDNTSGTTLYSKSGATTGTSFTFTPTASTLYNSIPAATSANCVYYCTYSSQTVQTKSGTYKVSGNNAEAPTFTNFDYQDTDTLASKLTGKSGVNNPGVLISGLSDCKFNITTSQKATSSYGAQLDHYNFAWPNGAGGSEPYNSSAAVSHTVQNGNTTTISVTAYDKRGQYKTFQKTVTLITPSHSTGSISADRQNGINTTTYLNGSISYWNGDWANGSSRPNNLYKVEYRINKTGNYYDITSAVTSNSTSSVSNKIKKLTLTKNVIQLHANGQSGGFVIGTTYTLELFITTGSANSTDQYYENKQKVAEINITSGIFGMGRYKDSSGKYHYSINGLPSSSHTFSVTGDIYATSFNNFTSRLTSGDIAPNSSNDYGGFRHDVATSSMTTNKPPTGDSHILTMFWDNSGRYDAQMALKDSSGVNKLNGLAFRGCTNGTWGEWKIMTDMIYPVGSIYLSVNQTDPGTLFGGTWTRITDGFLYCVSGAGGGQGNLQGSAKTAAASGNTGAASGNTGAASGNTGSTTLTTDQIPSHRHVGFYWSGKKISLNALNSGDYGLSWTSKSNADESNFQSGYTGGGKGHTHTLNSHTHTLNSHTHTLNSHTHSLPYTSVCVWKRTA